MANQRPFAGIGYVSIHSVKTDTMDSVSLQMSHKPLPVTWILRPLACTGIAWTSAHKWHSSASRRHINVDEVCSGLA